jgi:hypothetical protein
MTGLGRPKVSTRNARPVEGALPRGGEVRMHDFAVRLWPRLSDGGIVRSWATPASRLFSP